MKRQSPQIQSFPVVSNFYNTYSNFNSPHRSIKVRKVAHLFDNQVNPSIRFLAELNGTRSEHQELKYCGVCGDVAKSFHFGGLSCDSCKSFFRRSVQDDNYLHFECKLTNQCSISIGNRKQCRSCRIRRCLAIGMEKSWVRTEEERDALMKSRAVNKITKRLAELATMTRTNMERTSSCDSLEGGYQPVEVYQPQSHRMTEFLSIQDIEAIDLIIKKYSDACQEFPFCSEDVQLESPSHLRLIKITGTLIRRLTHYASQLPEFANLALNVQKNLLKSGVLEMCILRGVLSFDSFNQCWLGSNVVTYNDAVPVLFLEDISQLIPSRISQMHLNLVQSIQKMGVDEPTIALLSLIVLFNSDREGLNQPNLVEEIQSKYMTIICKYMEWSCGKSRSKILLGKLLTKLCDLRELSEFYLNFDCQFIFC